MSKRSAVFFILIACHSISHHAFAKVQNFDWILGTWERVNEQNGRVTIEIWDKLSAVEYRAISYTLEYSEVVWQENLRLVRKNDGWRLLVISPGESKASEFSLTNIGDREFIGENPELEFPSLIQYAKHNDQLQAKVEGQGIVIDFVFLKRQPKIAM